jgi:short chain dehydrogenase
MLAAEGIGVVVHGRSAERTQAVVRQIEDAGGRAAVALGDLMTEDGKAAVIDATGRAFGGVDILVNNAGGSSSDAARTWFETTGEEWTDSYRQNTLPAVALAQAFVPGMRERGWGRCIQISVAPGDWLSGLGEDVGRPTVYLELTAHISCALRIMHIRLKITNTRCRTRRKIMRSGNAHALTRGGFSGLVCYWDKSGFECHTRHLFNGSCA